MSIEISWSIWLCIIIVHCTALFHNPGGYKNSLILQALELPPQTSNPHKNYDIAIMQSAMKHTNTQYLNSCIIDLLADAATTLTDVHYNYCTTVRNTSQDGPR